MTALHIPRPARRPPPSIAPEATRSEAEGRQQTTLPAASLTPPPALGDIVGWAYLAGHQAGVVVGLDPANRRVFVHRLGTHHRTPVIPKQVDELVLLAPLADILTEAAHRLTQPAGANP